MELIDFTLVALIICIIYEVFGKTFTMYVDATLGKYNKAENIPTGNCLMGLFYIVFIIAMLWNPILWLPALLLMLTGFVSGGLTRVPNKTIKETLASGVKVDHPIILSQMNKVRTYWTLDKIVSTLLLGWMIFLHLQVLGVIA
jgi:hypothetical protein